jgi:hypothetical protein
MLYIYCGRGLNMTLFSIDKNMHKRYIVTIHGNAPALGDLLLRDGEEIGRREQGWH